MTKYAKIFSIGASGGGDPDVIILNGVGTCSTYRCGVANSSYGSYSASLGGFFNKSCGNYSVILGGSTNIVSGEYSGILGGRCNTSSAAFSDTFIIGSNIIADASCTTFVNNLKSCNLIQGSTVCSTTSVTSPLVCASTCMSVNGLCSTDNIYATGNVSANTICANNICSLVGSFNTVQVNTLIPGCFVGIGSGGVLINCPVPSGSGIFAFNQNCNNLQCYNILTTYGGNCICRADNVCKNTIFNSFNSSIIGSQCSSYNTMIAGSDNYICNIGSCASGFNSIINSCCTRITGSNFFSTVISGNCNCLCTNSSYTTIIAGWCNLIGNTVDPLSTTNNYNNIFGSYRNIINSGCYNTIMSSPCNNISGNYNTVVSGNGTNCICNSCYNFISGGYNNIDCNSSNTFIVGESNTAKATNLYSWMNMGRRISGYSNAVTAGLTSATGNGACAYLYGMNARSSFVGDQNNCYGFGWYGSYLCAGVTQTSDIRVGGTFTLTSGATSEVDAITLYGIPSLSTFGYSGMKFLPTPGGCCDPVGTTTPAYCGGVACSNSRMWNVMIQWNAVVQSITGTATGVLVGDTINQINTVGIKKVLGTSTIVGSKNTLSTNADTSMSTALVTYGIGGAQSLGTTFTAPTFAGGGSITVSFMATMYITENGVLGT